MQFTGRADRRSYIIAQLILNPLLYFAGAPLALADWNLDREFPQEDIPRALKGVVLLPSTAWTIIVVAGIAFLLLLVTYLAVKVRRLHDLDFSGWFLLLWPLLTFLATMSGYENASNASAGQIALEAVLMMVPGTVGSNDYGGDPRRAPLETGFSQQA